VGFWNRFGKIAAAAAPFIAAPFTGGTSLALIGAGAGAAESALSHGGVKGALLGAGLGATPGVLKSMATHPSLTNTTMIDPWYGVGPSTGASSAAPTATSASLLGGLGKALLNPSVLSTGLGVAGQLIGGKIAANSAEDAANIQAAYLEKALAYEKERDAYLRQLESSRYGDIQQRLGPYMQLGSSAAERIQRLLGGGGGALAGFMPAAGVEPPIQHVTLPGGPDLGVLPPQQPSGAPVLHTNPIPQRRV